MRFWEGMALKNHVCSQNSMMGIWSWLPSFDPCPACFLAVKPLTIVSRRVSKHCWNFESSTFLRRQETHHSFLGVSKRALLLYVYTCVRGATAVGRHLKDCLEANIIIYSSVSSACEKGLILFNRIGKAIHERSLDVYLLLTGDAWQHAVMLLEELVLTMQVATWQIYLQTL